MAAPPPGADVQDGTEPTAAGASSPVGEPPGSPTVFLAVREP